jgi:hypothetical protein
MYNGYNPLAPAGHALSQAWNSTANAFRQMFNRFSPEAETMDEWQYQQKRNQALPGYNYDPYQISVGDTWETIAAKNNISAADLQAANNGLMVPPPKGSYINLPRQAPLPSYVPNAQAMDWIARQQPVPPRTVTPGLGANSFTSGSQVNIAQLIPQLTQQLTSGALPPIPVPATQRLINPETGLPITSQELERMGYQLDRRTQIWRHSSAPAGPGVSAETAVGTGSAEFMNTGFMRQYAEKGTEFMNQKRYYKGKFVKIGDLVRRGLLDLRTGRTYDQPMKRNRKGKLVPKNKGGGQPAEQVLGSGATPSQQLNTNQSGG